MPRARPARTFRCPTCGNPITLPRAGESPSALREPLSRAQLRVLQLLNRGLTTKEIAVQLDIAVGTTRWHLNHIYGKLQVRNRTQAVVRARELRLL
jgi:LuxR family transcriptional regulator, maltose regulon positive regulatory protein